MKRALTLALLAAMLGGCAVVPLGPYGYRGDLHYRGDTFRGDVHVGGDAPRGDPYHRGDGYRTPGYPR
jgi:hypothetical protein